MKHLKRIVALLFLTALGCAPSVNLYSIDNIRAIPEDTYTGYFFSAGEGERLRVVLLKSRESDVEIVPQSVQIIRKDTSLEDAIFFMRERGIYRNVEVQEVRFEGRLIGYLLSHSVFLLSKRWIDVSLLMQNGKLYYSVRDIIKAD